MLHTVQKRYFLCTLEQGEGGGVIHRVDMHMVAATIPSYYSIQISFSSSPLRSSWTSSTHHGWWSRTGLDFPEPCWATGRIEGWGSGIVESDIWSTVDDKITVKKCGLGRSWSYMINEVNPWFYCETHSLFQHTSCSQRLQTWLFATLHSLWKWSRPQLQTCNGYTCT